MARNSELRIKLSKEELKEIKEMAAGLTIEPSVFARMVILNCKLDIKGDLPLKFH